MNINLTALETLLNNLISLYNTEIAYQISNGPKPSYSIGNRSVSWDEWRKSIWDQIQQTLEMIAKLESFDLTQQAIITDRMGGEYAS